MGLHASTSPILNNICSQMSGVAQPIENILDTNIKLEIEQNRKILKQIVDTVLFCGRLGIGLRGHRDDAQFHPEVGCYSVNGNVGNFVESLNFRVRAGDQTLENHLLKCGKNKSYISKTSQNKIINCIGQLPILSTYHRHATYPLLSTLKSQMFRPRRQNWYTTNHLM
ncbi:uncharacterized protein LOC124450790 [Xenia sp. Carnegie-2017]|nr:uncharacterized protein LOC124442376 isoform X2 [Xenia sp. Carnegie-2017]XP_046856891.1 uncharacterized protein LOC124450297 [Xenia sp. Carnegie-2017]XP_046857395.1 uncharacterized protein LOC124450790 [Xenia sp. Carnegie-2017]